ncbi:MAG: hypothetical protein PHW10_05950 [Candidatus Peribacteraceae bacterium]|nr:hypothetical protein [Candidatus Peribacteraceae bacterium]
MHSPDAQADALKASDPQTPVGQETALRLFEGLPGIRISSLGTTIPPEYRNFGPDDDVLENGEVLQVCDGQGCQVRVLVSKALGFPGERTDVLPDATVNQATQAFADSVKAALGYEGAAA